MATSGPIWRITNAGGSVQVGASGQITAQATAGQAIQLSANGATFSVTAAGAVTIAPLAGQSTTITTGTLDMSNGAIVNIGAAGTDFSGTGGLTLADALVVSAGNVGIASGAAYTYNGVNVVRAQTALNNFYFGNSGNLTGTGSGNIFAGILSGTLNTSGSNNSFFGNGAGDANTSGASNVYIGANAGYNAGVPLQTLTNCTFVGFAANSSVNAITNSTAIGNGAQVTASNQVVIGNASIANTKIMAGNLIVATGVVGTSGVGVLALGNGTVPSTSPADCIQLFSVDIAAGRATLGIRTEEAVAVDIALASTTSYIVNVNGANYKLLMVAV